MPYAVPTLIKQMRGTDQPCRIVPDEPDPPGAPPIEAPAWMTEAQQKLWAELIAQSPLGLLRAIDSGLLVQYVIAFDLYVQAAQDVNANGYLRSGRRGAM